MELASKGSSVRIMALFKSHHLIIHKFYSFKSNLDKIEEMELTSQGSGARIMPLFKWLHLHLPQVLLIQLAFKPAQLCPNSRMTKTILRVSIAHILL